MKYTILLSLLMMASFLSAQEEKEDKKEPPKLMMVRAEESYAYLKDKENSPFEKDLFDPIKLIPLSKNKNVYLTLGGEIRPRSELFINRLWSDEDEFFYSQRISFHINLNLGKYLRLFGELYHGYTSHRKEFAQYDLLDWHQGFIEFRIPFKKSKLFARLGRQELGLGAARLVGLREGPNIRRTFDLARIIYKQKTTTIQAFYGKEVRPSFEVFDNNFSLFDEGATNPRLWGLYTQFIINKVNGTNELYYLGFHAQTSSFADIVGQEWRHTVGLRRFGNIKKWKYNTELVYQFGKLGNSRISAFNIETDWHFVFENTSWRPSLGLKLDFSSGDRKAGDSRLNTFNPMFVNPAIYSLAAVVVPANLLSIHPSITLTPLENLRIYLDWGWFMRTSINDDLYQPPRFINRPANGITQRYIGQQIGFEVDYEFNRNIKLMLDFTYFIAGSFIKNTGAAENMIHIAPTLSFKF